jgi:hypothetical protein
MVGHVDGKPFRTEVTLLPETRIVEWQGQRIETLVSQYTAYLDGRSTWIVGRVNRGTLRSPARLR